MRVVVKATILTLTTFPNWSNATSSVTWGVDENGTWGASTNWVPTGIPNGVGASVIFGSKISSPHAITIDADYQIGYITFDNPNAYQLTGPGTLTLAASSGNAIITVNGSAQDVINVPVILSSFTTLTSTVNSNLLFGNSVSGSGVLIEAGLNTLTFGPGSSIDNVPAVFVDLGKMVMDSVLPSSTPTLQIGRYSGWSGTLTLQGSSSFSANNEYVGVAGTGSFAQTGGTNSVTANMTVAYNAGSVGTYSLSGSGILGISNNEYIGYSGTGNFIHTAGLNSTNNLNLGVATNGNGSYSLSGTGSLSVSGTADIGNTAYGAFNQSGGTDVINTLHIASNAGAVGNYSLSGGTIVASGEYVARSGTGSFNQTGGTNTAGNLTIGYNSGATGTYSLSGSGILSVNGPELIGQSGNGTFIQNAGAHTISSNGNALEIANGPGSSGTYVLSGGTLSISTTSPIVKALDIGFQGTGSFIQTSSALSISSLGLGMSNQGVGVYSLSGTASLSVLGSESVGGAGTGTFLQSSGSNAIGSMLYVGVTSGGGNSLYSLSGTGALAANTENIGFLCPGTFSQSGGTNSTTVLNIGPRPGGQGLYSLSGTGRLDVTGAYFEVIGQYGTGTFLQTGGTHSVSTGLNIAPFSGSIGAYSLSNAGVLAVDGDEYVGLAGTGSVVQSGGSATINGNIQLGYHPGANAIYTLSNGQLSAQDVIIAPYIGPGTFTQSGGTADFSGTVFVGSGVNTSPAIATLSGGALSIANLVVNGGGTFTQTGGQLSVSNQISLHGGVAQFTSTPNAPIVTTGGSSTVIPSGSIYSAGSLLGGTWVIQSGTSLTLTGATITTIAPAASVTLSGSTSNFSSIASLGTNAGTLDLDSRDWAFSPAGNIFHNSGTFIRSGSGQTTIPGTVMFDNTGTVSVNGGTLSINGPITQLSAGALSGGSWVVSGSLLIPSGSITSAAADITLSGSSASIPALSSLATNSGSLAVASGAALALNQSLSDSGAISIGAGSKLTVTGGLTLNGTGGVVIAPDSSTPGRLVVLGDISFNPSGSTTSTIASSMVESTGILDLGNSDRTFTVPDAAADVDALISANIVGAGVTKAGQGVMVLAAANSYAGGTTVSAGTLRAGVAGAIPSTSTVSVSGGATLDLAGYDQTIRSLNGSGTVMPGNASLTIGDPSASTNSTFSGVISGSGALSKTGASTLVFTGTSGFSGPLNIVSGVLSLQGASGALPFISAVSVDVGATLRLDGATSGNHSLQDRLPDSAPVTLAGGSLEFYGDSVNPVASETLGVLNLNIGASTIAVAGGASAQSSLSFSAMGSRAPAATVDFDASDLGNTNHVYITGMTPGFIGSWATVNSTDFAKYDSIKGVVPFDASDYSANVFAPNTNVRLDTSIASPPVPNSVGDISIYTLNLAAGSTAINLTQNAGTTLTLSKGGLIKSGASAASISGGIITSTSGELNISVEGQPLTLNSALNGNFILAKRGDGTLILGGNTQSTYSGVTVVSGLLELNKGTTAVPQISIPGDLVVTGGTVVWDNNDQVADSANVFLHAGTLDLNGFTDTIHTVTNDGGTFQFHGGTLNVTDGVTLSGGQTVVASTLISGSYLTISGGDNQVGSTGLVTISGTTTFTGINNPTITIASGAGTFGKVTVSGSVTFDGSGGTAAILSTNPTSGQTRGTLDLNNSTRTFNINDGSADTDMRISARIQNGGITKSGAGTLRLEAANTYTLGTNLSAGTLIAADSQALGTGNVTFNSTSTLQLLSDASSATFNNSVVAGTPSRDISILIDRLTPNSGTTGVLSMNALTLGASLTAAGTSGGTLRFTGPVTLTANATVNNSVDVSFAGALGGGFAITKTQPGTLILAGTSTNTYSGGTTVNSGLLQLAKSAGTTAIPGNLTINGGSSVQLLSSNQIADASAITLNGAPGAATLDLGSSTDTVGSLAFIAGGSVIGTSGQITLNGDVTFTGVANSGLISAALGLGSSATHRFTVADSSATTDLTLSGVVSGGTSAGSTAIIKDGPGRMDLTGVNSFVGNIVVSQGTLYVTNDSSLGNANNTVTLDGGSLISNLPINRPINIGAGGATFDVPASNTVTIGLNGSGDLVKYGAGTLAVASGGGFVGDITLADGVLRSTDALLGNLANTINLTGGTWASPSVVSSSRALTVSAGGGALDATLGAFTLGGSADLTLSGPLTIKSGNVTFNRTGGTVKVTSGASFSIVSGANLTLAGTSITPSSAPFPAAANNGGLIISSVAQLAALSGTGSTTVNNGGILTLDSLKQSSLAVTGTGKVVVRSGASIVNILNSLSITSPGSVDLTNDKLVIDYSGVSPADSIRQNLLSGRGNGSWTGSGLISSVAAAPSAAGLTAIGYVEASQLLGLSGSSTSAWNGTPVDATSLLLKYTYYGDLNFDGRVNGDDMALLDRAFAKHLPASWINGDVNYDNMINSADYLLVDKSFALQNGGVLSPSLLATREAQFGSAYVDQLISAVPEPGSTMLVGIGALGLMRRRRPR